MEDVQQEAPAAYPVLNTIGLDSVMEQINTETREQQEALKVPDNNIETAQATYSETFWFNEESQKMENGLGARFMLRKAALGADVSEYRLEMGQFVKTKAQRFHRKMESNHMDLSIREWKMFIDQLPKMLKRFCELKKEEEKRYKIIINKLHIALYCFFLFFGERMNSITLAGSYTYTYFA